MKKQRYEQLKNLSFSRNDLKYQLRDINDDLIKSIGKDIFKKYISSKIIDGNLSYDDIDELRFQILKLEGVKVDTNVSIYKLLYNLYLDHILLPDYVDGWLEEDIHKELDVILDRVKNKVDKTFEIMNGKGFFNISLGNIDTIENELEGYNDNGGFIDFRTFDIGGVFGYLRMGLFEEDLKGGYKVKVPIRLPLTSKNKVGEKEKIEKVMLKKDVDKVLDKYFPNKKGNIRRIDKKLLNKFNKRKKLSQDEINIGRIIKKFDGFRIEAKTVNNKDGYYGLDDSSYYLLTISHDNIKELTDTNYSAEEIIGKLELIFNLLNTLINDIAKNSGLKHNNRFINFANSYFYIGNQTEPDEIDKETLDKFSKMLIEMKTPIHLDDVGGQE